MKTSQITIQTTVQADIKKVWQYYTNPDYITKWNFASDDWHCPNVENDLRVGGNYRARMEAKDGSFGFDFEAVYDKVVDQKELSYTMSDSRQATTTFEDLGNNTRVTITFDADQENPIEMQEQGWQAILNNFKKYTEAN